MKLKSILLIAPVIASLVSVASGATILASNYAGADSSVVVDTGLNQIGSGFAAIGYFTIADGDIPTSNASNLALAFQILGGTGGTSYDVGAGFFMDGAFDLSASASTPTGNAFVGKNAYLVIGNGASLGSSTQAFIYKTNTLFPADPSHPITLDFTSGAPAGVVIHGATGVTVTPNFSGAGTIPGNEVTTAYQTAVLVPEPSAALLGAIGMLGLLRRRRA